LVHLVGCGGAGSGAGHRRAEARRRTSLGCALVLLGSCGGGGSGRGGGAGHRRAEVLHGAFLACAQLLVLMAYKVECSLFVGLCVCVRALPLELFVSTWWSFALCWSRKSSSLIGTGSSGGGAGHRRAEARRRTSLGRALVHLVGCGGSGSSGGGAGHRRAEARRRTTPGDSFSVCLELLAVEADLNVGNDRMRMVWSLPGSRHGSPGLMGDMADEEMRPAHLAFMASCAGHISSETLCSISRKETKTKNCEHKKKKEKVPFSMRIHFFTTGARNPCPS